MRISLENREFSLIIVNVSGAEATLVGHDPGYGRHGGERKNRLSRVVFFLFFCSIKTISKQTGMVKKKLPHAAALYCR